MKTVADDGVDVKTIRGYWLGDTESVNFRQYMESLRTMPPRAAAADTWTGRIAADYGYVNVSEPRETLSGITVHFRK